MRTLGEILHPQCKISLFSWNGKFLVKFEQGFCEQIYKYEHLEIDEKELRERVVPVLTEKAVAQFAALHEARIEAMES